MCSYTSLSHHCAPAGHLWVTLLFERGHGLRQLMPSLTQHTNPPTILRVRCHGFHWTPFSCFINAQIDVDSSSTFLIKSWQIDIFSSWASNRWHPCNVKHALTSLTHSPFSSPTSHWSHQSLWVVLLVLGHLYKTFTEGQWDCTAFVAGC